MFGIVLEGKKTPSYSRRNRVNYSGYSFLSWALLKLRKFVTGHLSLVSEVKEGGGQGKMNLSLFGYKMEVYTSNVNQSCVI